VFPPSQHAWQRRQAQSIHSSGSLILLFTLNPATGIVNSWVGLTFEEEDISNTYVRNPIWKRFSPLLPGHAGNCCVVNHISNFFSCASLFCKTFSTRLFEKPLAYKGIKRFKKDHISHYCYNQKDSDKEDRNKKRRTQCDAFSITKTTKGIKLVVTSPGFE
jgi:hypothetical protein